MLLQVEVWAGLGCDSRSTAVPHWQAQSDTRLAYRGIDSPLLPAKRRRSHLANPTRPYEGNQLTFGQPFESRRHHRGQLLNSREVKYGLSGLQIR